MHLSLSSAPRAALLLGLLAAPLLAQETPDMPFRGPPIHGGAWRVTHAWSDAADDAPGEASFAWAYRTFALARAEEHVEAGTRLDCADLSISLVIDYAARHGLPVTWRVYFPPEHRFVTISSSDAQFADAEHFLAWSQHYLGAMNLADNTVPVDYDTWASGDMVLMNWNQTEVEPNFPGRPVWHTYLVGVPDESAYYGNLDNAQPLPVTRLTDPDRLRQRLREHPDRYGLSPRRFAFLAKAVRAPAPVVYARVTGAFLLNVRSGPGTSFPVVGVAPSGQRLRVTGPAQNGWTPVRLADGRAGFASRTYLRLEEPAVTAEAPTPTTGVAEAVATAGQ